MRNKTIVLAVTFLLSACGNKSDTAPITQVPTTPQPTPSEAGNPQGNPDRPWKALKIFRSYTGDATCDSIELRINDDGTWSSTQCAKQNVGVLSSDDRARVETFGVEALDATTTRVCTQELRLDADYVHIEADDASPETARTFDPIGACYEGGATDVAALLEAMRDLRKKLTGYEP